MLSFKQTVLIETYMLTAHGLTETNDKLNNSICFKKKNLEKIK